MLIYIKTKVKLKLNSCKLVVVEVVISTLCNLLS